MTPRFARRADAGFQWSSIARDPSRPTGDRHVRHSGIRASPRQRRAAEPACRASALSVCVRTSAHRLWKYGHVPAGRSFMHPSGSCGKSLQEPTADPLPSCGCPQFSCIDLRQHAPPAVRSSRKPTLQDPRTAHRQRVKGPGCTGSNGPGNTEPVVVVAVIRAEVVAVGAPKEIGKVAEPRPAPNNAGTTP